MDSNLDLSNINIDCKQLKKTTIEDPKISIIIRTKNEEQKIEECLNMINKQVETEKFEIIIIDSGSTDNTLKICENHDVSIYTIDSKDFNFGTSINLGAKLSNGDFCVYLSAHAIPKDEYWLRNLINKFDIDNSIVATYSKQTYNEDTFFIERRSLDEGFGTKDRIQEWKEEYKTFNDYKKDIFFSNASSCIKKDIIMEIPFKNISASEDREWAMRALKKGYKIFYASDSIVYHSHNESIEKYYKRIFINSKALFQFAGVHINWYHYIPLIFINVLRDMKYLKRNKLKLNLKNIRISCKYRRAYAKAHYQATRKEKV